MTAQERTLKSILSQIEKDQNVYFSYNPDEVKNISISEFNLDNQEIEALLSKHLINSGLLISKINDSFYVIKKESSKFLSLKVLDSENKEALPFAVIKLENSSLGKVADDQGNLNIIIDKPSVSVLNVSFLGFEDYLIAADTLQELSEITISMLPVTTSLSQIEVKEYLNAGIASDPKANSFKVYPHKMDIIPGLSERDVLLSAQMIAGFNSNDESASGINLRGSSRDNTLLYWNNIPIYHTAHYFGHISSFIPSSIGEMDLYKNYIPVKYGGAAAGIIDLSSRNPIDPKITGEASVNLTHADLYLKLPFKKDYGSFMIAGRRSYNDIIPTWTYNSYETKLFSSTISDEDEEEIEEGEVDNNLDFSDFNFQWLYKPNSSTHISTSFVRSSSQFNYSERDRREKRNFDQEHHIKSLGSNLNFEKRLSDSHSINATMSYSAYEMGYLSKNLRKLNDPNDDDLESRDNELSNFELRLASTHQIKSNSWFSWGYQLNNIEANTSINSTKLVQEDDSDTLSSEGLINAGFIDYSISPNRNLELVLSSRFTKVSTIDDFFISPQVKLNYRLSDNLIFKSSYGIYHQFLSTIKEEDFTLSNAVEQVWLLADQTELVPVIANTQFSAGFLLNTENWLMDLDVYHKNIDGLLARNLGFATRNEDGYEQGYERLTGIDLTLRKRWRYFRVWSTYSFQDSQVEFPDLFRNAFPSSLNIRHQIRLTVAYSLPKWEFSLGYNYKSGLPFTDVNDIVIKDQDGNDDRPGGNVIPNDDDFFFLDFDAPNSSRLPNYQRVDASIWHRWSSKKLKGEIGLSFVNVLDRKNIFDLSYYIERDEADEPGESDELEIYTRKKYFLRFTPNFTFRIIF